MKHYSLKTVLRDATWKHYSYLLSEFKEALISVGGLM